MEEQIDKRKNFAWPVTSVNREDYEALSSFINNNKDKLGQIAIFGAGIRGSEFAQVLQKKGYNNIVFIDNNEQKWGGRIHNYPIISPKEFFLKERHRTVIISSENGKEIEAQLQQHNIIYYVIQSHLYDKYMKEFLRTYTNQVLLLADCEFTKISLADRDTRNMNEMLKEILGETNIKILAMHGMGLRAYYNILSAQIALGMCPEILVVMVNFDTLTGKQHLLPRSQHAELIQRIYNELSKPDQEWEEYRNLVWDRSSNLQAEFSIQENSGETALLNRARVYLRLNYLYTLKTDIEGMVYLHKIIQLAERYKIKVIPFIPAVNYMLGKELIGDSFIEKYNDNIKKIENELSKENVKLFDLSYTLTNECFADKLTPDETLNEQGRKVLSELFSERIEEEFRCRK